MKLGIEIEFWVVDEDGRLCDGRPVVERTAGVEPEFIAPLIEVQTAPHADESAVRRELQETLQRACRAAKRTGRRLVPLGTPLTEATAPATTARGDLFERIYGEGITSAKNCAGMHVHFDAEAPTRQLNVLTALDPATALVSSSPYYLGRREETCSRAAAYRRDCGPAFQQFCELWPYADGVDAWETRVTDAYESFRELATDRGVDPTRVDDLFEPPDTVLNPVRLRSGKGKNGTVEWRAPDTALPSQLVDLAFDVHRIVEQAGSKPVVVVDDVDSCGVGDDAIRVPSFPLLRELSDEAIRDGLTSPRVCTYLERMGFDTAAYEPISQQLRGPEQLYEPGASQIRLLYAELLRGDAMTLTASSDQRRGWPARS
ncbi:glutamate-cysteine ligase family protein [Halorarius litoreus]|uniref:glutamate-cysteine ligase family protein n=1 Tax=Halorarius litoreus TaxID=2962676 RepID=UPI0020CCBBDA|nr:glutamate-cysteine ligase family protein [Halorarius litoreus]